MSSGLPPYDAVAGADDVDLETEFRDLVDDLLHLGTEGHEDVRVVLGGLVHDHAPCRTSSAKRLDVARCCPNPSLGRSTFASLT